MKNSIKKKDARFIVNEEKRKVVCIIDNTDKLFIDYVYDNLRLTPAFIGNHVEKLYDRLEMPKRFIGIASCDPRDEFVRETGELVAFSRAKDKLNKSFFKRANLYINTLDEWLNDAAENFNQYGEKLEQNTERRHKKIEEILKEQ